MNEKKNYNFYVIEIFEPPYGNSERYVCIPNSWIRLRESVNELALVTFPVEELSETKKRVKRGELLEDWTVFWADVKYGTDSYKDANEYIKILNKISFQEQNRSNKVKKNIPSTFNKNMLKPLQSSKTKSKNAIPIQSSNTDVKESEEKAKPVEATDSISKTQRYMTRQSVRRSLSANTVSSLDQTATQNSQESTNCIEENSKKHIQENEAAVEKSSELSKKQIDSILRSILGDHFKEQLEQHLSQCESTRKVLENIHHAVLVRSKIITELIKLAEEVNNNSDSGNHDDCRINITIEELVNSKINMEMNKNNAINDEVTGLEMQINTQKGEETHSASTEETSSIISINKIHGKGREFTLPPEYDPDDSRWTLKHRVKKRGLIELIPHSGVYVDATKLGYCTRTSNDSKVLARKLLVEVFSKNALSICSITGKKPNIFDIDEAGVRPGLDEHGRNVLLNYVEQFALEKKWPILDKNIILNSIRNKMHEFRGKYYELNKTE